MSEIQKLTITLQARALVDGLTQADYFASLGLGGAAYINRIYAERAAAVAWQAVRS
jgi:hypothetical protein